jgi:hypothetical protein
MWLGLTTVLTQVKVVSFVGYFSRSESSLNNPHSLSLDSHDNPKSPHDINSIDSPDNIDKPNVETAKPGILLTLLS